MFSWGVHNILYETSKYNKIQNQNTSLPISDTKIIKLFKNRTLIGKCANVPHKIISRFKLFDLR